MGQAGKQVQKASGRHSANTVRRKAGRQVGEKVGDSAKHLPWWCLSGGSVVSRWYLYGGTLCLGGDVLVVPSVAPMRNTLRQVRDEVGDIGKQGSSTS